MTSRLTAAHPNACLLAAAGVLALLLVACGPSNPAPTPGTPTPARSTPEPVQPPPADSPGEFWLHPIDEMPMVYVPAGLFILGSASAGNLSDTSESPTRTIHLDAYWIDLTEVTNGMFALCVLEGGCTPPDLGISLTRSDYYANPSYGEFPVVNITWQQAADYCAWAGRRLPTEAEWEKAARGTDGRTYPWGEEPPSCELLMFGDPGPGKDACGEDLARVGSHPLGASPYGALDMAGNAWEWVADWYSPDAYETLADSNPTGPSSGEGRVLRGGGFSDGASAVRSANRHQTAPENPSYLVSFRCALTASP